MNNLNNDNNIKDININVDPYSHIAGTVSEVIEAMTKYLSVREANITERKRIAAALETATLIIMSDTEKFRLYIENEYKDKNRLYESAEMIIKLGLQDNNINLVNTGCNFMLAAFNKNPIDGYKSQIDFSKSITGFFPSDMTKRIECD